MNELTLMYLHKAQIGYGRLGVELAAALSAQGVDLYDGLEMPDDWKRRYAFEYDPNRREKRTNAVCWLSVPGHARGWWEGQHLSILTMWEATRLPEAFRTNLPDFDQVIVPSAHNVELFSKYHDNVSLVPLGVNPTNWHYTPRQESMFFDFLIAGSGDRKGQDIAARAFRDLWPTEGSWGSGRIPRLVFKSPRGNDACRDISLGGNRMVTVSGFVADADEVSLYASAHCYLGPSRGEGFGLQPLQALAQGIPTILTNAHGQAGYAHLGLPVSAKFVPAGVFMHGDAGQWWEPDYDEFCDQMLEVYHNYDHALAKAKIAAKLVARDWTWANTAAKLTRALGDVLTVPYSGNGEWYVPDERLFPMILTDSRTFDIAGIKYQFRKGEEQWVPADVKRIMFEAGYLDPVCIDDDTEGLLSDQVARLGKYRYDHAYCDHCGQRLNSQPTRADDIEAELTPETIVALVR